MNLHYFQVDYFGLNSYQTFRVIFFFVAVLSAVQGIKVKVDLDESKHNSILKSLSIFNCLLLNLKMMFHWLDIWQGTLCSLPVSSW